MSQGSGLPYGQRLPKSYYARISIFPRPAMPDTLGGYPANTLAPNPRDRRSRDPTLHLP